MKKFKYLIIYLILIILIFLIVLGIILAVQKKEKDTYKTTSNSAEYKTQDISLVKDESEYHNVERIVNKYFNYINYLDYNHFQSQLTAERKKQAKEEYLKKGKEALENVLVNQMTKDKNWTEKLATYVDKKLNIIEMNKYNYNQMTAYLVTLESKERENTNIIIFVDENNNTFSIMPDKIQKNIFKEEFINIVEERDIELIDKNNYNTFEKISLDEERICLQYYYDYLDMLRNDADKLFNTLNKEYREKRFNNIEEFKDYINNNKEKLQKAVLSKYQVKNRDDCIEYICTDEDGRYYIFYATAAMKYTLLLDTYTIDTPEFTEKYNSASAQEKVALNISRVITAINNEDYKYFYSKLADSFKNNYFKNQEELEEYWKNELYKKFEFKYLDFNREGNLYTYKIRITKEYEDGEKSPEGKNAPSKNLNIVMQLNEGTDFVMSFSIIE